MVETVLVQLAEEELAQGTTNRALLGCAREAAEGLPAQIGAHYVRLRVAELKEMLARGAAPDAAALVEQIRAEQAVAKRRKLRRAARVFLCLAALAGAAGAALLFAHL